MADADDGEREVLTSLPRSRPVRRSSKRGERARPDTGDAAPGATATKTTAKRKSAASSSARKPPAAKAKRPAPANTTGAAPKPKGAAKPRARPAEDPKPKLKPRVAPERKVPPAGYASPSKADGDDSPGATEILTTAVQAAAELAQIGLSVGRQALQSALERLPKP